ncbi:MAG: efflux RND transporter permease subunit [Victivallales bacterium]|nr:efflux RND transporter permease subunit [Victivallales bacterium]
MRSIIKFCLENKLIVFLAVAGLLLGSAVVAPFDWKIPGIVRYPVSADAIPDIGENQQIVFTQWEGRSPQDVENQITNPLTVSLLGIPKVRTIRSTSMFGFSSIYIIFEEDAGFYWSRSRILEKLSSLPPDLLPHGVSPSLGPDATALGQVFWYTLEGLDEDGQPVGGWGLDELRGIQDWQVRHALLAAGGVSEVASVGGFVKEYQVDVDPDALRAHGVTLEDVYRAVSESNLDVGARSIEINKVDYLVRGVGFVKSVDDIASAVLKASGAGALQIRHVAKVVEGPAFRQGALDKGGTEAVGGVVVARFGANPLITIQNVKKEIERISPGLPWRAVIDHDIVSPGEIERFAREKGFAPYSGSLLNHEAWVECLRGMPRGERPEWAMLSQVRIVPFYDRSGLIYETLGTLGGALYLQILVTVIVILAMVRHIRSSVLISCVMPMAVAMCFIFMKLFGIEANIVALSGIAIAIGTVVDMGIVVCENILRHVEERGWEGDGLSLVLDAAYEEGGAVLTAVSTTVVSFMVVFSLEGAEGKLFRPLAYTYIFVLAASLVVALTIVPAGAHTFFSLGSLFKRWKPWKVFLLPGSLAVSGLVLMAFTKWWAGLLIVLFSIVQTVMMHLSEKTKTMSRHCMLWIVVCAVSAWLALQWLPLGPDRGIMLNLLWVASVLGSVLGFFALYRWKFNTMLSWCLDHKLCFASLPVCIYLLGLFSWLGFGSVAGWLPGRVRETRMFAAVAETFPGLSREFMPPLDEGSFLFMPTTMPHASIGEVLDVMQKQNLMMLAIPEVESAVGKLGRADSPLDPAPVEMIETLINYKPQYMADCDGRRLNFKFDGAKDDHFRSEEGIALAAPDGKPYIVKGSFERDQDGRLIPDPYGRPFRLWRPPLDPDLNQGRDAWSGIRHPDDIWAEIARATEIPGTTSAPRLQPIAARLVMLQTGMRAPMGVKVKGPSLEAIQAAGIQIESFLKEVPSVAPETVFADRIIGKPYLEIRIDRAAAARFGISVARLQETIEVAVGGRRISTTVEGRERYPIRVRYMRDLRDSVEALERLLVTGESGLQIPLSQLARIVYVKGPQEIRSEDGFLTGYVLFDKAPGMAEVDVVEDCERYLRTRLEDGTMRLPQNVSYHFAGTYENQVRASKKLILVLPMSLMIIFIILYLQFHSIPTAFLVFVDIGSAWAAGFIMLWLCAQPWFLDFAFLGVNLRELFQVGAVNLSVAVWVGFLALFGIATDDGVVLSTCLDDSFKKNQPSDICEIRKTVVEGASLRVRACLMTTATTVLALIPVFTSTGRGADVMRPMAIPVFAGMLMATITPLFVPVLYCWFKEIASTAKSSRMRR